MPSIRLLPGVAAATDPELQWELRFPLTGSPRRRTSFWMSSKRRRPREARGRLRRAEKLKMRLQPEKMNKKTICWEGQRVSTTMRRHRVLDRSPSVRLVVMTRTAYADRS